MKLRLSTENADQRDTYCRHPLRAESAPRVASAHTVQQQAPIAEVSDVCTES